MSDQRSNCEIPRPTQILPSVVQTKVPLSARESYRMLSLAVSPTPLSFTSQQPIRKSKIMRLRIRPLLCGAAIFSAVCLFNIAFAETSPFSKAQVADRIRKVENGVDEFEKYLTTRGENASDQAGAAKNSGSAKRGQNANAENKDARKEQASGTKRRPPECDGGSGSHHQPSAAQVRCNGKLSGDQSANGAGPGQRAPR